MKWNILNNLDQLELIINESKINPVLIFKHSTRCSISSTTINRLERNWNSEELKFVKPYYLDLISFRDISNAIVEIFEVDHESPQVLIIENGKSIFNRSHLDIDYNSIKKTFLEVSKN